MTPWADELFQEFLREFEMNREHVTQDEKRWSWTHWGGMDVNERRLAIERTKLRNQCDERIWCNAAYYLKAREFLRPLKREELSPRRLADSMLRQAQARRCPKCMDSGKVYAAHAVFPEMNDFPNTATGDAAFKAACDAMPTVPCECAAGRKIQ